MFIKNCTENCTTLTKYLDTFVVILENGKRPLNQVINTAVHISQEKELKLIYQNLIDTFLDIEIISKLVISCDI